MSKSSLISELSARTGHSQQTVEAVLDKLAAIAESAVANDHDLVLPGIGKISTKVRGERNGRNPSTGEMMRIAAKKAVVFKASSSLVGVANK